MNLNSNVYVCDPIGYLEFMHLLGRSDYVLSDSGTVVEEACILGTASIQLRFSTERPEVYDVSLQLSLILLKNILNMNHLFLKLKV